MKTFTTLKSLATNLSNNTSTDNDTLMGQLINDQHRYLIQKYFDNERTATVQTVGGADLTLTGALLSGATSGTLTGAWAYSTVTQLVNFSNGDQRPVLFTSGSAAITWNIGLSSAATESISSVGVQSYRIPANVSKLKNDTINVGQLRFQPMPVRSRQEWDMINYLPYTSDIPQYYFIWNNNLEIFPIPSTTGNILTFNYQVRVPDLSFADYSTGTLANGGMTAGGITVTGSGTSWNTPYPEDTDLSFYNLFIRANPPFGDGIWYPIRSVDSATQITLATPVINAPNITGSTTYTIGQLPLLQEDFHDMIVYGALKTYYSAIVKDTDRYKQFDALYQERLDLLKAYAGTRSVNVDLGGPPNITNPNLFIYAS